MRRPMCLWIGMIFLTGCAAGHPSGQIMPLPQIGMNLGIGDLVKRPGGSILP